MSKTIEYYFDYESPFTYLANTQLPGILERTGAVIDYRPVLLGALQKTAENPPPITVPNKSKYMMSDLSRWAKRYGVTIQFNPAFPINTVTLLRAALVTLEDGSFPLFHEAMFDAMWRNPKNLGDEAVVREVLEGAGLDAHEILQRTQEQAIKDRLKANTSEAHARGAFGAPTFFVGDEMYFGNDRLDFVEEALK